MSEDFQNEVRFLGMDSSPSFIRQPEGHGCIERFFHTLKERLLWVRHFETVDELQALLALCTAKPAHNNLREPRASILVRLHSALAPNLHCTGRRNVDPVACASCVVCTRWWGVGIFLFAWVAPAGYLTGSAKRNLRRDFCAPRCE